MSVAGSPSLFGNASVDHAVAGFVAGTVATLVMHPLDLVKVRFQLSKGSPSSSPPSLSSSGTSSSSSRRIPRLGTAVYRALEDTLHRDGWRGLYRGLVPNLAGGASSWGLYFLLYNMIKKQMQGSDPSYRTTSGQHLLAAAEASAITAMVTNPIWVVKTRVFATGRNDSAYHGLFSALGTIYRQEGLRGLYKGSLLALVGVSNGSIQFAAYESIKRRRADLKRRVYESSGRKWRPEDEKLTNTEYILASGSSKLIAIALTYPYQVIRARIQNAPASLPTPSIPSVIASTYRNEGVLAFYKGLGTNALRILPGTCTTFVVYENLVWLFRSMAVSREHDRIL